MPLTLDSSVTGSVMTSFWQGAVKNLVLLPRDRLTLPDCLATLENHGHRKPHLSSSFPGPSSPVASVCFYLTTSFCILTGTSYGKLSRRSCTEHSNQVFLIKWGGGLERGLECASIMAVRVAFQNTAKTPQLRVPVAFTFQKKASRLVLLQSFSGWPLYPF